jgi:hypothetical protein
MAGCESADNFPEYKQCRSAGYPEYECEPTGDFDRYMRCVFQGPPCHCPPNTCSCAAPVPVKGLWELLFPDKD